MNAIFDTRMRLFGYFPLNTKLIQTHIVFKYKHLTNRIVHNNRILGGVIVIHQPTIVGHINRCVSRRCWILRPQIFLCDTFGYWWSHNNDKGTDAIKKMIINLNLIAAIFM